MNDIDEARDGSSHPEALLVGGHRIPLNAEGFLASIDVWNSDVADALAELEGIASLNPAHWTILRFLHEYYRGFGIAPSVRKLCHHTGSSADSIWDLFPSGPARGACRIAGLPSADGCV